MKTSHVLAGVAVFIVTGSVVLPLTLVNAAVQHGPAVSVSGVASSSPTIAANPAPTTDAVTPVSPPQPCTSTCHTAFDSSVQNHVGDHPGHQNTFSGSPSTPEHSASQVNKGSYYKENPTPPVGCTGDCRRDGDHARLMDGTGPNHTNTTTTNQPTGNMHHGKGHGAGHH